MHTRTRKGEVYRKGKKWYLRHFDFRVEDGQLQYGARDSRQFGRFIESTYMPRLKEDMRPSTYRGYTSLWAALKPLTAFFSGWLTIQACGK